MSAFALRPLLSSRVPVRESRTEAFGAGHFGKRGGSAAVELRLCGEPNRSRALLAEVLVDLCLRMDPIVSEVRVVTGEWDLESLLRNAAKRFPFSVGKLVETGGEVVRMSIGPDNRPFVDAGDWVTGFGVSIERTGGVEPVGAFLGALEAAKVIFMQAVAVGYGRAADQLSVVGPRIFDAWRWTWCSSGEEATSPVDMGPLSIMAALVGCGGVGAGYLWFLRQTNLRGRLILIDDDTIAWHNMNRLPYATISDADGVRLKVEAAADYMRGPWNVHALSRKAEHEESVIALTDVARAGGLVASAVGEPETRRMLARRGFELFFDAATNSDGWMQALALKPGFSTCAECHIGARPSAPQGCAQTTAPTFVGVVPHQALYAGVLLALEQLRVLRGAAVLGGSSTMSVLMPLEDGVRIATRRCTRCIWRAADAPA